MQTTIALDGTVIIKDKIESYRFQKGADALPSSVEDDEHCAVISMGKTATPDHFVVTTISGAVHLVAPEELNRMPHVAKLIPKS